MRCFSRPLAGSYSPRLGTRLDLQCFFFPLVCATACSDWPQLKAETGTTKWYWLGKALLAADASPPIGTGCTKCDWRSKVTGEGGAFTGPISSFEMVSIALDLRFSPTKSELASPQARLATEGDWPAQADWL